MMSFTSQKIQMMERYRYWVDKWWSCRYNLAIRSCSDCLFQNLCLFEYNQERCSDIHKTDDITSKDSWKNM